MRYYKNIVFYILKFMCGICNILESNHDGRSFMMDDCRGSRVVYITNNDDSDTIITNMDIKTVRFVSQMA
jgi:hypothetical protein